MLLSVMICDLSLSKICLGIGLMDTFYQRYLVLSVIPLSGFASGEMEYEGIIPKGEVLVA